ncbi:MAG: hypothetical protein H6540_04530 [Bacteroidales bacterium]|nr:hypothetical protein [Bacteroidales bacterium]MCB9012421.1 hypothetical protein [Bacteroidales bacterium]
MTKQTNRNTYIKQEYLPAKLTGKLQDCIFNNSKYQYPTKNNFLQCVSTIYYHQVTKGIGLNNYVPLGRNYWHTVYGGNYHEKVINPLLNEYHIIQSEEFEPRNITDKNALHLSGTKKGSVSIRYRINPDLLGDKYENITYIDKRTVLTALERMMFGDKEFIITGIPDMNFRVSIDHDKACKWVDSNAELICDEFLKTDYIKTIPDGLKIECKELIDKSGNWTYNTKYRSIKAAKIYAETRNKEFFYFKDTFYIADLQEFLKQRVQSLKYHYKQQIAQLGIIPIEEKRNPVTLRLYSQLTSFPSKILQFININNKTVVQLDLRTSQFLIFANLLNLYIGHGEHYLLSKFRQEKNLTYLKKLIGILNKFQPQLPNVGVNINDSTSGQYSLSDVTKFIRDVFFTDFYGVVQQELGLQERLLAKHVMFKLLFKKTNRPDELLSRLSQRYPVVMNIIADFKKPDVTKEKSDDNEDNRESNFSVFLQCIEGEIFVDNILHKLRDEGIPCFTRHDSIVVSSGSEGRSEEIAKQIFTDFGFKYNHTVEDKFWEAVDDDEIEFSDYMQWLIDENELNQAFYVGENVDDDKYEPNEYNDMDEEDIEILEKLREIGIREDYYGIVDTEFLEELTLLTFLNERQRNILYEDINNMHDGMSFFQDATNKLLRQLLGENDGISGMRL